MTEVDYVGGGLLGFKDQSGVKLLKALFFLFFFGGGGCGCGCGKSGTSKKTFVGGGCV